MTKEAAEYIEDIRKAKGYNRIYCYNEKEIKDCLDYLALLDVRWISGDLANTWKPSSSTRIYLRINGSTLTFDSASSSHRFTKTEIRWKDLKKEAIEND